MSKRNSRGYAQQIAKGSLDKLGVLHTGHTNSGSMHTATRVQSVASSLLRRDATRLSISKQLDLQKRKGFQLEREIKRDAIKGKSIQRKVSKLAIVQSRILELAVKYQKETDAINRQKASV